ncbi:hypothetical protein VaNZ11_013391, partial [Volvox africanus]
EEELLAMQEEFLGQQRRPAANVARVSHRNGSGAQLRAYGSTAVQHTQRNQLQSLYPVQNSTAFEGRTMGPRFREALPGLGDGGGDGGPGGNIRGDEDLALSTEQELLQMQDDFISRNSQPAAKVTRLTRRGPPASAEVPVATTSVAAPGASGSADGAFTGGEPGGIRESQAPRPRLNKGEPAVSASVAAAQVVSQYSEHAEPVKGGVEAFAKTTVVAAAAAAAASVTRLTRVEEPPPPPPPPPRQEREPTSILGPIEGLLGDVVERRPSPSQAPTAPRAGPVLVRDVVAPFPEVPLPVGAALSEAYGRAGASFPEAMHRRQSKFALSRKTKQQSQSLEQQAAPRTTVSHPSAGPPRSPPPASQGDAVLVPATTSTLTNCSLLPSGPVSATATSADQHVAACVHVHDTVDSGGGTGTGGGGGCGGESRGELGAIGEQNREAVARMRPEEVAAALEELSSRMAPEALEFLRRRGAQRLTQRQQPQPRPQPQPEQFRIPGLDQAQVPAPAPAGGGSARLAGDRVSLAPGRGDMRSVSSMASCATQEDSNVVLDSALRALTAGGAAGPEGRGEGGAALPASVAAPGNLVGALPIGALVTAQRQQQQTGAAAGLLLGKGGRSGGAEAAAGQGGAAPAAEPSPRSVGSPADPRLVARLRFDLDGAVVDVQGPEEVFVEEEVLLRDHLRRDEGSVPPGYTLGELLVLCRSAVAAQRVAGLAAIADLAAIARPRPEDLQMYVPRAAASLGRVSATADDVTWTPGQMIRRFVPIPEHLRDRAPAYSVSWQEVWQFFVSELGLAAHLRLALDDDRPAVLAAA